MTDEKAGGRGGSIVLVSAAVAELGLPNYEAMSAAKAGVEGEGGGSACLTCLPAALARAACLQLWRHSVPACAL
jgi:hypothetical protein